MTTEKNPTNHHNQEEQEMTETTATTENTVNYAELREALYALNRSMTPEMELDRTIQTIIAIRDDLYDLLVAGDPGWKE